MKKETLTFKTVKDYAFTIFFFLLLSTVLVISLL
jgi:hypothetical protein